MRNICYGAKALARFGTKMALAGPRGYSAGGLYLLQASSARTPANLKVAMANASSAWNLPLWVAAFINNYLAEREGFEPTVPCRITVFSSVVENPGQRRWPLCAQIMLKAMSSIRMIANPDRRLRINRVKLPCVFEARLFGCSTALWYETQWELGSSGSEGHG
jgi:hypothetical protein